MSRNTYQSYTPDTPLDTMRADFIRRAAMCTALTGRYPALAEVAGQAAEIAGEIDAHAADLRAVEDDAVRAKALEDAEKIDVIDVYGTLRTMLGLQDRDHLFAFLPDPPSVLGRMPSRKFSERLTQALANLEQLPAESTLRGDFVPRLREEMAGFRRADEAEDDVRRRLRSTRLGMVVYKSELARARDAQLGVVQTATRDRAKTVLFTLPWRKSSAAVEPAEPPAPVAPVAPSPVPPA